MRKKHFVTTFSATISCLCLTTQPAMAVDWQDIPGNKITLFYPGQASWEWLLTEHKGADYIKSGQTCRQCHEGMQSEMGQKLVSGSLLENAPIADKPGSIEVEVKTAHDENNLYLHLEWTASSLTGTKLLPDFEAMASVLLDDGKVPEMTRGGCWGACHADANGMPHADSNQTMGKYLVKSRSKMSRKGGGDNIKEAAELNRLFESGFFTEIWQARLNRNQPATVSNGYVLEARHNLTPTIVSATAVFDNGKWSVDLYRPLAPQTPGLKNIVSGKTLTFGIAIHDGFVNGRRHYVSFSKTLRLDEGPADFIARQP